MHRVIKTLADGEKITQIYEYITPIDSVLDLLIYPSVVFVEVEEDVQQTWGVTYRNLARKDLKVYYQNQIGRDFDKMSVVWAVVSELKEG